MRVSWIGTLGLAAWTLVGAVSCTRTGSLEGDRPDSDGPARGGRLIVTYRSEPRSFNRYVSAHTAEELLARLTQANLVRLNRVTREVEPRLARDWTVSPDGLTWTLRLQPGVTFSDGAPFTSADVLFSFQALYDPKVKSPLATSLMVGGKPFGVRALDDHTVIVTLPAPYGPGISLLDALPILPRHKLGPALEAGTFAEAWGVRTAPSEIVGLGPFVVQEHVPGQRLVLGRNPRYWRRDDRGRPLPYLDQLELQIVPEQNSELIRLEAGAADLVTDHVRPEDLASLRQLEQRGRLHLAEAGVSISPDLLWFNLTPGAAPARQRAWLQRAELRRAVSHAVDRKAIVETVYLGAAEPIFGPITPGHGDWYLPDLPRTDYDPARAKTLLASIGLTDRTGDGLLDDASGRTARFSILTVTGRASTERSVAMIQEHLRKIGLTVDVIASDLPGLIGRFSKGEYDAIMFYFNFDSFDPARNMDFWRSSGSFHVWHPNQATPATGWEARIDDLMTRQSTSVDQAERRRLFADAQRTLAEHLPVLYFAAPKIIVATSSRVSGVAPSVLSPPVLWNAEMLSVSPMPPGAGRR